jgi:hypothetical protein
MGGRQLQRCGRQHRRRAGGGADHVWRTGRGGNGWRRPQYHSPRRRQYLQRQRGHVRGNRRHAGEQLHAAAERFGTAIAGRVDQGSRDQPDGRRPDSTRPSLVLPDVSRGVFREHASRHVVQQERRRSDEVGGRFRHHSSCLPRPPHQDGGRADHVAGLGAQQDQRQSLRAVRRRELRRRRRRPGWWRRWCRRQEPGSGGRQALHAGPHPAGVVVVSIYEPLAVRGRVG